ncbi:MAG: Fpg/Nei family DNA glycosylase [Acidimicrobiales bacterium]
MPEGDTLARTARSLDRWIGRRLITAAEAHHPGFPGHRLAGQRVEWVEAAGKNLLIHLGNGATIRSHLRMTGSWHVYAVGRPWQRPRRQARLVIEAGDRLAVCFNAPVLEWLEPNRVAAHPGLSNLGPDILGTPLDLSRMVTLIRARAQTRALGEALLDQTLVAGIGNIWRCEALHARRIHPWTQAAGVDDTELIELLAVAGRLMSQSVEGPRPSARVYRRTGRPCPTCATPITSRLQGPDARRAYWCPACQPGASQPDARESDSGRRDVALPTQL